MIDQLNNALKHLDARVLPDMDKFNGEVGENLTKYFTRFESYCAQKFKGKRYLWINELEKNLDTKTSDALKTLRQFDDDYEDVKRKLLNWYKDQSDARKVKTRKKFERARPLPQESMFAYSSRLESLYKVAFPNHSVEESTSLVQQFKNTVPKPMRKIVKSEIINRKMKDKKVLWSKVQKLARIYDVEGSEEDKDQEKKIGKPVDVVINLKETPKQYSNPRENIQHNQHSHFKGQHESRYNSHFGQTRPFHRPNYNSGAISKYFPRENNNRFSHPTRFSRPPNPQLALRCKICNWFGHESVNCPKRLGQCFKCGENDHFIANCPNTNFNQRRGYSISPEYNRDNFKGQRSTSQHNFYRNQRQQNSNFYNSNRFQRNWTPNQHDSNWNQHLNSKPPA